MRGVKNVHRNSCTNVHSLRIQKKALCAAFLVMADKLPNRSILREEEFILAPASRHCGRIGVAIVLGGQSPEIKLPTPWWIRNQRSPSSIRGVYNRQGPASVFLLCWADVLASLCCCDKNGNQGRVCLGYNSRLPAIV